MPIQKVHLIANPVSGTNREAIDSIKAIFEARPDLQWQLSLTEKSGDARRFAHEAAQSGVDAVAVFGGDGTVMEAADGLRETTTPLAIFPGGTANVMSVDLGVPRGLEDSIKLLLEGPNTTRAVDMISMDNTNFILRAGIGYEAEISVGAGREEKKRMGVVAYWRAALRKLNGLRPARYVLTLDDEPKVAYGVTCMLCNSANVGLPNLKLVQGADISDGLLDVIILRSMRPGTIFKLVFSTMESVLPFSIEQLLNLDHWQARHVTVETTRRQMVAIDGEAFKRAKRVTARVLPGAVQFIVPPA